jgi:hypothetical protein
MTARAITILCAVALCSGCFDIQQSLTINRDLSGTAGFNMKIDLEPMVFFMAKMEREMSGKTGDPTPEDLAKARQEFASSKQSSGTDLDAEKKTLAGSLPPGVTLLDASMVEAGLGMQMNLAFGFDNLAKLADVKLPKSGKGKAGAAPEPGNPVESPFGGLKVQDEGATIFVTGPPQNPVAGSKDQAPPDPETQKMVADMLKGLRVVFRISSPMEVVLHNAHKKVGDTLVWEYDLKALEKLKPSELNSSIKVRYRK